MACGDGGGGGEGVRAYFAFKGTPPQPLHRPASPSFIHPNCAAYPLCWVIVCTLLAVEPERMLLFQALPSFLY